MAMFEKQKAESMTLPYTITIKLESNLIFELLSAK
jgi:hypothetical protein